MAAHQHLARNHSHTNKFFREIKKPACICYPTGGGIGSLKPRLHMAGGVLPSLFLACLKDGIVSFLEAVTPEFQPFIRLACL